MFNFVLNKRPWMPCVLIAGISTAVLPLEAPAPAYAAFDYNIEQIAPAIASQLTMADIAAILNETVNNSFFVGGIPARDDRCTWPSSFCRPAQGRTD